MTTSQHRSWRLHLSKMGRDGLSMFVLSNVVIVITGGLSLLWCLRRVHRIARDTPSRLGAPGCRLVLGMCLGRAGLPRDFELRLERARRLRGAGPILILGGRTGRTALSEAAAGRDWLVRRGCPPADILIEDGSTNTLENLQEVRRRLRDAAGAGTPVLITSRYHLARSSILAGGLGIGHRLCAAEDRLAYRPRIIGRLLLEAYLLHWYAVGRGWATLTGNRAMLGRIT